MCLSNISRVQAEKEEWTEMVMERIARRNERSGTFDGNICHGIVLKSALRLIQKENRIQLSFLQLTLLLTLKIYRATWDYNNKND